VVWRTDMSIICVCVRACGGVVTSGVVVVCAHVCVCVRACASVRPSVRPSVNSCVVLEVALVVTGGDGWWWWWWRMYMTMSNSVDRCVCVRACVWWWWWW
jgi:hypothetical protein